MAELAEWESFYVIVGSAAGTLIGLQFVVVYLARTAKTHCKPMRVALGDRTGQVLTAGAMSRSLLLSPWRVTEEPNSHHGYRNGPVPASLLLNCRLAARPAL